MRNKTKLDIYSERREYIGGWQYHYTSKNTHKNQANLFFHILIVKRSVDQCRWMDAAGSACPTESMSTLVRIRLNTFFSSVFPDTSVKMAGGVGGALKSFRALVNNWEKNQNAELKLNCKDGHWLVNYSWTWLCGWPIPPSPSSNSPSRGSPGPQEGAALE